MNFELYQSPFSWRYGSDDMRRIWSEENKRLTYRKLWAALARIQSSFGLVTQEQVDDLTANIENINIDRALEIESEIHHDLMAEIKAFAEQCSIGGGIIHLGATSDDIKDNTDILRIRQSLDILLEKIQSLLLAFTKKIDTYANLPIMAYTHLQPAEPTTLGYRLAFYAQDILISFKEIKSTRAQLRGKGFRGAVGTSASFSELIGIENLEKFDALMSEELNLPFFEVTTQTYPRKQDYQVVSALSSLGSSLYKFAFDLRILQSPMFGEVSEPFKKKQVGSSAMPFKRNPIKAENIDSLGRYLAQLPRLAWDNAAHSLFERTLDDSGNRRIMLPESFLVTDELLKVSRGILEGFQVNKDVAKKNFDKYGPFAATERLLMALSKKGADRQEMHEQIRKHTLAAWDEVQKDNPNPLTQSMTNDKGFLKYLSIVEIENCLDASKYIGDAPKRAMKLAQHIKEMISFD
ncbi:MAG: adenylosuccinate lyase [Anaerolineales bacterium]|jgi:adenylosuccinate lyase